MPFISGFDVDLTAEISKDFKKEYEIYTSRNPSHSSRKKVYITKQRKSCHLCYCQAREWVTLWHRVMGHRATPQAMIDALQKMLHTEDLVEQIRMERLFEILDRDCTDLSI